MLVNISNHPSTKWGKAQLKKASKFGEVVDYPFPDINPEFSTNQIKHLAEKTTANLMSLYGRDFTAHVMGELTFTHALVCNLQRQSIICVTSTTKRNVQEVQDGAKVSHFEFVSFREYMWSIEDDFWE